MKVSNKFISRKIAKEHLLIPVGEAAMNIKGTISEHFGPDAACNRAQIVTFLYRAYN